MKLNNFVNRGTDELILKSLTGDSVHVDQEELSKTMSEAGMIQKDAQTTDEKEEEKEEE